MRDKPEDRARVPDSRTPDSQRLRSDLEDLGIDPEFSRPVADRLATIAVDLSKPEYAAVLDGVLAAYGVHRGISESSDENARHENEVQRLLEGFTGELRKLDEGLRMLSAYLIRMGALSSRTGSGSVH